MNPLVTQLAHIQKNIVATKSKTNTFGKYQYRTCEDIMTAIKPFLGDVSVIVTDDLVMVGDRYYVKATATITDGKNTISNSAYAREPLSKKGMDDSQLTGATSSYARKYALAGLFLVDDNKDADSHDNRDSGVTAPELVSYTPEQKAIFDKLLTSESDLSMYVFMESLDHQVRIGLGNSFELGQKGKYGALVTSLITKGRDRFNALFDELCTAIDSTDETAVDEVLEGLGANTIKMLEDKLNTEYLHAYREMRNGQ